jgi:hypothetical protein
MVQTGIGVVYQFQIKINNSRLCDVLPMEREIYTAFFISLNIQCEMAMLMFSSKMDKSIHLK